jgi:outer membrane immunogenic protein
MQKKLSTITLAVIATTLLLGSASALAAPNYKGDYKGEAMPAPCPQPLTLRDGFYIGGQIGYDSYRTRVTKSGALEAYTATLNPIMNPTGFVGGLFAGYGMYWSNFYYLGAEALFNGSGATASQTYSFTSPGATRSVYTTTSTGASWGVSLLPGVKVNESTLTYIRLGYNQARIRGKSIYTSTAVGGGTAYGNTNSWQGGFNYGLGIETAVYPNVSVRTEYSHTNYNTFSDNNGTSYAPGDNQFMLSLIYHFA